METTTVTKKEKQVQAKKTNYTAIRVGKATGKLVHQAIEQANKKDFGKRVNADKILARAVAKLTQDDIKELQEGSLSNQDRFERDYAAYCAEHGKVSKDEYLGKRLKGEISA
jgi:hypothetical protein